MSVKLVMIPTVGRVRRAIQVGSVLSTTPVTHVMQVPIPTDRPPLRVVHVVIIRQQPGGAPHLMVIVWIVQPATMAQIAPAPRVRATLVPQ